jgi:MFS family permease
MLQGRVSARPQSSRAAVRKLAAARLISLAGTDATGVAIGFALYSQTHSARWLSLSLLLTIGAGAVLAPLGGRAGDLLDRKRLMIVAELAACCVFATLALVHTPAALIGLGLLATSIGTVFGPASGAAIAHIAGDRDLSWANGLIAMGANLGKTAGRLVAGMLVAALGAGSVFAADAVTFLASALVIASIRQAFSAPRDAAAPARESRQGGLRVVLRDPTLRPVVMAACASTLATGFSMTAEVPLVFQLHAGAIGLGALTACWGAGMAGGSWYAGRVLHQDNEASGVLLGRLAMAAGVGFVAFAPALEPTLACYLLGGAGGGFMGVASQSLVLRRAPEALRARTLGAIDASRNVAFGIGVIAAGVLVAVVAPRVVYGLVGVVMATGTLPLAAHLLRERDSGLVPAEETA